MAVPYLYHMTHVHPMAQSPTSRTLILRLRGIHESRLVPLGTHQARHHTLDREPNTLLARRAQAHGISH